MAHPRIPLEPDTTYHIHSHGVGAERIFLEAENYRYFLFKLQKKIGPFCTILAYCLLPHEFHLVVRIKSKEDLLKMWDTKIQILKRNLIL